MNPEDEDSIIFTAVLEKIPPGIKSSWVTDIKMVDTGFNLDAKRSLRKLYINKHITQA